MQQSFRQFIAQENLCSLDHKILLAVSGGKDSMCMASLFLLEGYSTGIVHCNFGLRGVDSDGDEYFVREWAAQHEIPFYSRHFDTEDYAVRKGISIQMAARELRYNFFEELRERYGYDRIATAHHRDDAIETFFINLIRGTGIVGLKGMNARTGNLIRPLLFAGRAGIESFVESEGIRYRNDASNEGDDYLRNRLRHHVIPVLNGMDPGFPDTMAANLRRFREAADIYKDKIQEIRDRVLSVRKGEWRIATGALRKLHPLPAYLFELIREFGFNEDHCLEIIRSLDRTPGKIFLSPTHRLLLDREALIIRSLPENSDTGPKEFQITLQDVHLTSPLNFRIHHKDRRESFEIPSNPHIACLDEDRLEFPLILRKWKKGDVFHPLGARGKKKLSDFFTDHKFTRFEKENCWLLVSGGHIVWVVGYRVGHNARVTDQTRRIVIFQWQEQD